MKKNSWLDLDRLTGTWLHVTRGINICRKPRVTSRQGPILISLRSSENYNVKFRLTGWVIARLVCANFSFLKFLGENFFSSLFLKFHIQWFANFIAHWSKLKFKISLQGSFDEMKKWYPLDRWPRLQWLLTCRRPPQHTRSAPSLQENLESEPLKLFTYHVFLNLIEIIIWLKLSCWYKVKFEIKKRMMTAFLSSLWILNY